jgi:transposase
MLEKHFNQVSHERAQHAGFQINPFDLKSVLQVGFFQTARSEKYAYSDNRAE